MAGRPQEVEVPATPYVGRRVARPAEPVAAAPAAQPPAPLTAPAPAATLEQVLSVPVPRVSTELVAAPAAPSPFVATRLDETAALPFALTEAFTGSLPRLYDVPGTDFSADSTANLPAVRPGGKRRRKAPTTTTPLLRRLPSLPVLIGVAALAVATAGAVKTSGSDVVSASGPLLQASALGGTSATGTVGSSPRVSVTRGTSREDLAAQAAQAVAAMQAARSQTDQQHAAYSADLKANMWGLPITAGDYHLTARFGDYGLWAHLHTGLDFACPTGTPIHAVSGGTITEMGWAGAYGNRTVETLPDGTELWYAHQSAFGAKVGERVTTGQVIGYVGATGNVTGPHVHLEVRPGGGDPVDPDPALKQHGIDPDAYQS